MKTVLVTGGAGYVGSLLARTLLHSGYRVLCIDNLRFGGAALIDIWDHPNFIFKKADLTHFGIIDQIVEAHPGLYGIVHLAALVGDPACGLEPELARRTNLDASLHLIEKARGSGIERFVFASTCSNYGKMAETDGYVDETSPLKPVSLYAELKVEVEKYLLEQVPKKGAFFPTCLRFATVYGLSPRMRFDLTVNEFVKELALGRELVVFGEQFWRPYCHVGDFSRAILAVLAAPREKVAFDVFNVGATRENYTKKMIVEAIQQVLPEAQIKYVQKTEDPRDYRVRFEKIEQTLGFKISRTVPQGIAGILGALRDGVIADPDAPIYYNTPVKK